MNELKVFENQQFGQIRTLQIDGEPWFVGKDVAKALGYANTRQAIATNVDSSDKGVNSVDTPSGVQNATIINESGLYSLILSSKLKAAKQFKNWITKEVIPSIRKTGGYIHTTPEMTNEEIMAKAVLIAQAEIEKRDARIQELESGIFMQNMQIKVWQSIKRFSVSMIMDISNISHIFVGHKKAANLSKQLWKSVVSNRTKICEKRCVTLVAHFLIFQESLQAYYSVPETFLLVHSS